MAKKKNVKVIKLKKPTAKSVAVKKLKKPKTKPKAKLLKKPNVWTPPAGYEPTGKLAPCSKADRSVILDLMDEMKLSLDALQELTGKKKRTLKSWITKDGRKLKPGIADELSISIDFWRLDTPYFQQQILDRLDDARAKYKSKKYYRLFNGKTPEKVVAEAFGVSETVLKWWNIQYRTNRKQTLLQKKSCDAVRILKATGAVAGGAVLQTTTDVRSMTELYSKRELKILGVASNTINFAAPDAWWMASSKLYGVYDEDHRCYCLLDVRPTELYRVSIFDVWDCFQQNPNWWKSVKQPFLMDILSKKREAISDGVSPYGAVSRQCIQKLLNSATRQNQSFSRVMYLILHYDSQYTAIEHEETIEQLCRFVGANPKNDSKLVNLLRHIGPMKQDKLYSVIDSYYAQSKKEFALLINELLQIANNGTMNLLAVLDLLLQYENFGGVQQKYLLSVFAKHAKATKTHPGMQVMPSKLMTFLKEHAKKHSPGSVSDKWFKSLFKFDDKKPKCLIDIEDYILRLQKKRLPLEGNDPHKDVSGKKKTKRRV